MIKIYIDQVRDVGTKYIEEIYTAYEIVQMDREMLLIVMKRICNNVVHTCYSELICHVGRFVREYGENWAGKKVAVYAKRERDEDYVRYYFNEKGQLKDWPYGFFG